MGGGAGTAEEEREEERDQEEDAPHCGMREVRTTMCSGSEAGSYVRLIDLWITQL